LDDILGLLVLAVYIVGIVGLAAAITFAVIRIFPTERKPKNPDKQESSHPPSTSDGGGGGGGKLFRKSKRVAT
jgi:hypothetical protein